MNKVLEAAAVQVSEETNPAQLGCNIDLIMRLHQFAFSPSPNKPNPYVDESQVDLGRYLRDVFGSNAATTIPSPSRPSQQHPQVNITEFLTDPEDFTALSPPRPIRPSNLLAPMTPVLRSSMPRVLEVTPTRQTRGRPMFNLPYETPRSLIPPPPPSISSRSNTSTIAHLPVLSPSRDLLSSDLSSPLACSPSSGLLGFLGSDLEDEFRSQESLLMLDGTDAFSDPLSSDFFSDDIREVSSPLEYQPAPFHGLPTPEDTDSKFDREVQAAERAADYTPVPVRHQPRPFPSLLTPTNIMAAAESRKRKNHEDAENMPPTKQTSKTQRTQCKVACVACKRANKKCDSRRPCERCERLRIENCEDAPRKERTKGARRGKRAFLFHGLCYTSCEC
ncbi:hypothetical protein BC832DRAFT_356508 [Gaertneriomyces semiglobifer]|nr:hypothetical protein BC832DRAFT_356508 [Gaertneriomyces semiglobifer]